jgi:diguanylate cyclase (GGDEF)-like protein
MPTSLSRHRGRYIGATQGGILSNESGGDPRAAGLSEQEIQVRLQTVSVGLWLTVIVSLGIGLYALLTWDQPNRSLILAITVIGLASAPLIRLLPLERIVRGRWREPAFVGWSTADLLLIAACAALDGGARSPYALFLVLPFLFAALSYPPKETAIVGAITVGSFALVAFGIGGGFVYSGMGAFVLISVALLSSWEARNQAACRRQLAQTAEALRASEATSRIQARQQREVASFGQLALGGADTDALQAEAVRMLTRTLQVGAAAVLRAEPAGEEFLIVAGDGLPDEAIGHARVPTGDGSQSGYTLATGSPTVVADWRGEERFSQVPILAELGSRSGITVLIKAKGSAYGVLGVQHDELREFSPEDVSFLQAVANILANAIERHTAEEENRHQALHDPLTTLPNRNLFLDRLGHALAQARRRDASVAVLFVDLDQFKLVNDSFGHAAGDELLSAVAPRIQQALRPSDTVARFGGDEFAVLAEDVTHEHDAIRVAELIAAALTRPFVLRHREHFVSASIGISIGSGGETPEALMRDADAALYRAKDRGRGGYEVFDEAMRARVIDHMQTENALRRGLQRGELELHYQPIVSLADRSVVMLEALLRWRHPERGLVGPMAFIPVAEESRLMLPIGRWVLEQACRDATAWQALAPDSPPVGVAVNLSARELADPHLLHSIESAIKLSGIDPSTLRLELSESTLSKESHDPVRTLSALQDIGVRLVLDDFGTGFSSLGYLQRLPLSAIKLDGAFVQNLTGGSTDAAIVRALTQMAETLGLDVCAEGIESPEQLAAIEALGCSHAQGFHFSEPVPASELAAFLGHVVPAD